MPPGFSSRYSSRLLFQAIVASPFRLTSVCVLSLHVPGIAAGLRPAGYAGQMLTILIRSTLGQNTHGRAECRRW